MNLRPTILTLVFFVFGAMTAAADFGAPGTQRFGAEQREFFDAFLKSKAGQLGQPVKSLVGSHEAAASMDRPPMDLSIVGRDPALAGEAWFMQAIDLYAAGQYAGSAKALEQVVDPYRQANQEAVSVLQTRLALRGFGSFPEGGARQDKSPEGEFNMVLADLRTKNHRSALARLKGLSSGEAGENRDRSNLWLAILLAEQGQVQEALAALSRIDGESPLAVDALLTWMAISPKASPVQLAAIEKHLTSRAGSSALAWEARDRLLQSLRAAGATADASAHAVEAVTSVARWLAELSAELQRVGRASESELVGQARSLPDDRRQRVEALVKRRQALEKMSGQIEAWRPYMAAYRERLRRDRVRFSDEVGGEIQASRNRKGQDSASQASLLNLELARLFGRPSDSQAVYRIFFGLAQWELGYEYPESWRPVLESDMPKTGDRRKLRELKQRQEKEDKKYLPLAIGHLKKLDAKIKERFAKVPKVVYEGLADESAALIDRGAKTQSEVAALLPRIQDGVRAEFVGDLQERRGIAQRWLVRFAATAIADLAEIGTHGEQPHFALDRSLAPKRGEPLLRTLEFAGANVAVQRRKAAEPVLIGVLDALKPLTADGESREIRADALRLRAQLSIMLYEAQVIASAADAVDHYKSLLRDYADLVDPADALYQLARAQDLAQQTEQSLATLLDFSRKFPKDPRAVEAAFRIADAQFALSEYVQAKPGYEAVLRTGDKRFLDHAEYKLAWTLYKLGDYRGALPRFVAVVDRGYGSEAASDTARRNRMQDAFRALSLTLGNLDGAAEVERFFAGKAKRPYVGEIYYSLARYFIERKRINDAAKTYSYLHKHYPTHERGPELLAATVLAARQERLSRVSLELQEQYVDRYGLGGAYWAQASEPLRAQITADMEKFLAQIAQMYHADAQQQKRPESFVKAIRYYDMFVSMFPRAPETPQYRFLLAEARYETGDVKGALADYEKVAYDYGAHPKAAEAGYALLVATQKLAAEQKAPEEHKAGLRLLVARSGRFAEAFPADTRVEPVLVKASEDILMLGDAAEAVRLVESLLARKPSEQVTRRAQQVSAHAYFESGAFAKAEAAYVTVLAQKGRNASEEKELRDRLGLSVYRQAEAAREAGQSAVAIDTFLRVAKTAPGTESVPNAEIDAAALLLSGKRWSEAITVLERFEKTFPGHKLGVDIPVRLAFAYENDGRFALAADMLERLSLGEKDDALARQMLWRSAELREKAGRMDLAVATYERYLVRYPTPLEKATEVRQSLADLGTKDRDQARRDRWLNEIIANARANEAQATVRVRFLAAQASVVLGDTAAYDFAQVALKLPLDKSLATKRGHMEVALKWFAEAGRYGIAEVTTSATYKTAEIYRQLAKDVMASERPSGLKPLELSQYDILLEEQATPFEEKATEFHEINYQRIVKGQYDPWVRRSLISLRALQPAQYDKVEVEAGIFEYVPPPPPKPEAPSQGGTTAPARIQLKGAPNAPAAR